jgi:hypothetical protein
MRKKNHNSPFPTVAFIAVLGIFSFSTNVAVYGVELLPLPQRPQTQQRTPESSDDQVFLNRIDALGCPDLFALREGIEKIRSSTSDPRDKNYYVNYLRMINNVIATKKCKSK